MPIGQAANPCPQTGIAENTFTDFFSSFNKQSFFVLGETTTSPIWLEEMVWGKGMGKEYGCCLLKEMTEPLNSSHPWKKRKNWTYFVFSWSSRWRWYVWELHVFVYSWSIGQRHCFVCFSVPLCSVGHRVNWENSSGRWKWSLVYFLDITAWNNVIILSSFRLTHIDMFDWVVWFEYSSQNGLSTKIFTIAVGFKSREIIYQCPLFSTMICIFPYWSITILIDIMRRRYSSLFDHCSIIFQ